MRLRSLSLAVAFVLLSALSALAQDPVAVRFYIVPKIGTGIDKDSFRPKYVTPASKEAPVPPPLVSVDWNGMDYGAENVFLIAADVTPAQHTTLSAQADVLAFPVPLDNTVSGAALPTVQSTLEALNIPGSWVTTSTTYRQVIRVVAKAIVFAQRYNGLFEGLQRIFDAGVTLDTRWNQLTNAQQTRLLQVAANLGIDSSGVTSTTTMRVILRTLAGQLPSLTIRGESF